jgi:nitrous oxidase accessory protein
MRAERGAARRGRPLPLLVAGVAALALVGVVRPPASGAGALPAEAGPPPPAEYQPAFDPAPSARAEIRVGPGGDAATLAEGLAMAGEGDRVVLLPGVYRESPVVVDRPVELVGEGFPVVDGEGTGTVMLVTAPGVTIRGLVLRGAGRSHVRDHAAVLVENAPGCIVEGNRLEDNFFGVYLARSSGCVVRGNLIRSDATRESDSGNGIHLWDVRDALIEGNRISGHRDGIYLEFARGATIRENESADNVRYGLHFMFSDESLYEGNTFRRNGAGVAVMYSRNVAMVGNRFEDNWGPASYGLLLKEVQDSRIEENLFRRNTVAIYSEGSDRLAFRRNRVERNGWAVKIQASSQENLFTANDFIENTFDVITNSRRSFNTFDGNYWSRYDGYDLTGDGVGDVPYRPVRLFSFVVDRRPVALILLRSFFVDLLEVAERVLPVLTPETLVDENPRMREVGT